MPHRSPLTPAVAGLVLSIGLLPAPLLAQDESAPSTLPELVRAAIATHEDVARADSQIRRAQADIKLTSSALLPRLDLNGSWTKYQDELAIELVPGESFVIRPADDWLWSADLTQTLFYGLRDWRARDIAKLTRDIAELQRTTVVNDLTLTVAAAFYTAVAAEQRVEVERAANKLTIIIFTSRPGIIVGKKGSEIEKLKKDLQVLTGRDINLKIQEINKPELDANGISMLSTCDT